MTTSKTYPCGPAVRAGSFAERIRWALLVLPMMGVDGADLGRWLHENTESV